MTRTLSLTLLLAGCTGTILPADHYAWDSGARPTHDEDAGELDAGEHDATVEALDASVAATDAAAPRDAGATDAGADGGASCVARSERCNGVDDDCDGAIDEGLVRACGAERGVCEAGTQTCTAGSWGSCEGALGPSTERCNNADDDCDGSTDEDLSRACSSNVGLCSVGTQTCRTGSWRTCSGVTPVAETLDGRDEDCDGSTDEDFPCNEASPRRAVRNQTNARRRDAGLTNLRCNQLLIQVANAYAARLCREHPTTTPLTAPSHTDADGNGPSDRVRLAGGHFAGIGENLGLSSDGFTAATMVDLWMGSSGHRANILNPAWRFLGVGYNSCTRNGFEYWVQVFGR